MGGETDRHASWRKRRLKYRLMELPLLFRTPSHSSTATATATTSFRVGAWFSKTSDLPASRRRLNLRENGVNRIQIRCSKASTERTGAGSEGIEERERRRFTGSAMEVTTFDQSFGDAASDFPLWEKIGAVVRLCYGIGQFYLFIFTCFSIFLWPVAPVFSLIRIGNCRYIWRNGVGRTVYMFNNWNW